MRGFSILIILIVFGSLFTGCITKRGTKVDTSNLIQLPNGTWKLKPLPKVDSSQKIEPIKATLPPSKPVKFPPARVKPAPTTASSAVAQIPPVTIQPAGAESEPFTPTISSLPPFPVVDTSALTGEETAGEIAGPCEMAPAPPIKVSWTDLWLFYLYCAMFLFITYSFWRVRRKNKLTKDSKKVYNKKNENRKPKQR